MKTNVKWLGTLAFMCAMAFAACGGGDSGSSGDNGGGGGGSIGIQQLAGTWQAIYAQGTTSNGPVDTKELYGIDSLSVPAVIVISPNNTYITYNAQFAYHDYGYINGIFVPMNHTWYQGGLHGSGSGSGSVVLVGNSLQLTDASDSYSTFACTIVSLTDKRLTVQVRGGSTNLQVTYGRDGDGAEYYTYPYINKNPSFVGNWLLAESTDRSAPVGTIYTFNSNGTGYSYGLNTSFTFTLLPTGEFTIDMGYVKMTGIITITSTTAKGYYCYSGSNDRCNIYFIRN